MISQKELFFRKPYVLVVDDIAKNLQLIGSMLMEEEYEFSLASSGAEALDSIKQDKPDLILLDVMMPEMNGYEVCKILKENNETGDIPIIFLTARVETEDIVTGFKAGGEDYVTKPFNKDELIARINTHLKLKFSRDLILKQNNELILLNNEKNEFLGIAAHDLKNPLNAIRGLAELLIMDEGKTLPGDIVEYSEIIKQSSDYMLGIIYDLLNINAIEEGKISYNFEKTELDGILESAIYNFNMQAEKKDISIHFKQYDSPSFIMADIGKIRQVAENIISNAIKFSPFGKNIWIDIIPSGNIGYVCFRVKDEGPGLSYEDKQKLFGKFVRLSARPTNNEHSTGLGLSIVKKLVEGMNGKIWCESEISKGASFFVEIPKAF